MYKIGETVCNEPTVKMSGIRDIVSVKYDGVKEQYVACPPNNRAIGSIIVTHDDQYILVDADCNNKELLIDIV